MEKCLNTIYFKVQNLYLRFGLSFQLKPLWCLKKNVVISVWIFKNESVKNSNKIYVWFEKKRTNVQNPLTDFIIFWSVCNFKTFLCFCFQKISWRVWLVFFPFFINSFWSKTTQEFNLILMLFTDATSLSRLS